MAAFEVVVRDARTGAISTVAQVDERDSVFSLKLRLRECDAVPTGAIRLHLAHHGRVLADTELLSVIRADPMVVVAAILPDTNPSAATSYQQGNALRSDDSGNQGAAAHRLRGTALPAPSPEQIAAAWERAFPAGSEALHAADTTAATQRAPETGAGAADVIAATGPDDEERSCRVCFCGEEAGPLIAPCRCRGSVRLVHASCLNEWRAASANPLSFERCETCGYAYKTQRAPLTTCHMPL